MVLPFEVTSSKLEAIKRYLASKDTGANFDAEDAIAAHEVLQDIIIVAEALSWPKTF